MKQFLLFKQVSAVVAATKIPFVFFIFLFYSSLSNAQTGVQFDGSNDYIEAAVGPKPDYLTAEAWVEIESFGNYEGIISNNEWTSNDHSGYILYVRSDGRLGGYIGLGNAQKMELYSSPGALTLDTWTHVAMTYDGTDLKLFIDGVEVASETNANPEPIDYYWADNGFNIGRNHDSNFNYYFDGMIDEVRVWDVVRTAAEITTDMNKEFCGTEAGLVGYYQMNCSAKPGEDKTGNHDATMSGAVVDTALVLTPATCGTIICNGGNPITISSQVNLDNFANSYGCDCTEIIGELTIAQFPVLSPLH